MESLSHDFQCRHSSKRWWHLTVEEASPEPALSGNAWKPKTTFCSYLEKLHSHGWIPVGSYSRCLRRVVNSFYISSEYTYISGWMTVSLPCNVLQDLALRLSPTKLGRAPLPRWDFWGELYSRLETSWTQRILVIRSLKIGWFLFSYCDAEVFRAAGPSCSTWTRIWLAWGRCWGTGWVWFMLHVDGSRKSGWTMLTWQSISPFSIRIVCTISKRQKDGVRKPNTASKRGLKRWLFIPSSNPKSFFEGEGRGAEDFHVRICRLRLHLWKRPKM